MKLPITPNTFKALLTKKASVISVIAVPILLLFLAITIWVANSPAKENQTNTISHAQQSGSTRLGLHVTQEELNCWRQRARIDPQGANGITCPVKYKTAGDVSTNSPGNWNDMVSGKNAFNS